MMTLSDSAGILLGVMVIFLLFGPVSAQDQDYVIDFTANITLGEAPLSVEFTDISTVPGEVRFRSWNFGDGTVSPSMDAQVIHEYINPGIYSVRMDRSDDYGSHSLIKYDYIQVTSGPTPTPTPTTTVTTATPTPTTSPTTATPTPTPTLGPEVPPSEFYGPATLNGAPAPVGSVVAGYIHGEQRGSIVISSAGSYGGSGPFDSRLVVHAYEQDLVSGNPVIQFTINGQLADQTAVFTAGSVRELGLSVTTPTPTPTTSPTTATPTPTTSPTTITPTVSPTVTPTTTSTLGPELPPAKFYGTALLNGIPVPAGSVVAGYIHGEQRGNIIVTTPGIYGGNGPSDLQLVVHAYTQDLSSGNPVIQFTINGQIASQTVVYSAGMFRELNLTATGVTPTTQPTTSPTPTTQPTTSPTPTTTSTIGPALPPAQFYGSALQNDLPVQAGTVIAGYINGQERGYIVVETPGIYGGSGVSEPRLLVRAYTQDLVNGNPVIHFTVGGLPAGQTVMYTAGSFQELNLTASGTTPTPTPTTATPTTTFTTQPTTSPTPTTQPTTTVTPTTFPTTQPTPPPSGANLTLYTGWNFISIPVNLAPGYNTAGVVFFGVDTASHSLFSYNASTEEWNTLARDDPLSAMESIWIYSREPMRIDLVLSNNQTYTGRDLVTGWNGFGIPGTTIRTAAQGMAPVNTSWAMMIGFDARSQGYEPSIIRGGSGEHSDTRIVEPGKGYWVFMSRNQTYIPA